MKRIRACGVIVHKKRVVLLWRKVNGNEYFVFPGGKHEVNETLEEAVVREVMEETSLEVKVEKLLYKVMMGDIENNFFLCSYISGEPKLGNANEAEKQSEINQYEPMWKNIDEFPDLEFKPNEIREWFMEDSKNDFSGKFKELVSLI